MYFDNNTGGVYYYKVIQTDKNKQNPRSKYDNTFGIKKIFKFITEYIEFCVNWVFVDSFVNYGIIQFWLDCENILGVDGGRFYNCYFIERF